MDRTKHPPPNRNVDKPKFSPPPGSCDCHVHIIGPQTYYPRLDMAEAEDSTLEEFRRVQGLLGMSRAIIVGGGGYKYDYRHVLHAITAAPEVLRGVVMVAPDITDKELELLDGAGVVGARFYPKYSVMEERLLARIAEIGWSAHFQFDSLARLEAWGPHARAFRGPVVIEHAGFPDPEQGLEGPKASFVLSMLETDRCWVKLSPRFTKLTLPPYEDTLPILHEYIRRRPDRMLYGSDYPHPNHFIPMPNEAELLDLMLLWAPDPADQQRILVDNPAELFGFPPP